MRHEDYDDWHRLGKERVFQVHVVDERGETVLKKQLKRDRVAAFFVNFLPCLVGMEACGSAHH